MFLGGEASLVRYSQACWMGGFADATWDFGTRQMRHAIGPELGWGPFGIDVGHLGALHDSEYWRSPSPCRRRRDAWRAVSPVLPGDSFIKTGARRH